MIQFDTTGLTSLSADLGRQSGKVVPLVRKALEVTARNIKEDAQKLAGSKNSIYARAYPHTISYDFKASLGGSKVEIGPTLGGQGSLGGILEEGGIHNAPQNNLTNALRNNVDDFQRGIEKAVEDSIS